MSAAGSIENLTIKGFKSIADLDRFPLSRLNVLIGANGAGKSNFVSYFRMVSEMSEKRLQNWTQQKGGAERILSFGIKETPRVESLVEFGSNGYQFILEPTVDGGFLLAQEKLFVRQPDNGSGWKQLGSGIRESALKDSLKDTVLSTAAQSCYDAITGWKVFHFHDTSDTASVKRWGALHDNQHLSSDASNLAAYLYRLREEHPDVYEEIRKTARLAIPFFDDFVLQPRKLQSGEEQIQLLWRQKDSAYSLWPSQLSDGSIRFICLTTALLKPDPPSTIIIDEPELGLHPYAIVLLGALLRSASHRMQIVVSTQSTSLVNEFAIRNLIVVEQQNGKSIFNRPDEQEFASWLEAYALGELWEKNVLGGRPG